jgi:hypothetical protein
MLQPAGAGHTLTIARWEPQTVINSRFGALKHTATSMAKTRGLPNLHLLPDWHQRYEALKLRLLNPLYQQGQYAIDLYRDAARQAAALYKIHWGVDVESYADVTIEGAISDVELELQIAEPAIRDNYLCHLFLTKWPALIGTTEGKALQARGQQPPINLVPLMDTVTRAATQPTHQRRNFNPHGPSRTPARGRATYRPPRPPAGPPRPASSIPPGCCKWWWTEGDCRRQACPYVHDPQLQGGGRPYNAV